MSTLLGCRVGTTFDWSVVVHAYGDPTTTNWALRQPYQAYTFADLPQVRLLTSCMQASCQAAEHGSERFPLLG